MLGVYFSGSGNTKFCLRQFLKYYDKRAEIISIEDSQVRGKIKKHKNIVFAYPIYFSNLPKIVRDFLNVNNAAFKNKNVFIIATMGLFSGDGTGCSARLFRSYGAKVIGGLHLKMPDCISDEKALKRSFKKNKKLINNADKKIEMAVKKLKSKNPTKEGLGFIYHIVGLFGQRLWFYNKTKKYSNKLKINLEKCIGCGKCIHSCPMNNISISNKKAIPKGQCTMCYRCINQCPQQAITLLGKRIVSQHHIKEYTKR